MAPPVRPINSLFTSMPGSGDQSAAHPVFLEEDVAQALPKAHLAHNLPAPPSPRTLTSSLNFLPSPTACDMPSTPPAAALPSLTLAATLNGNAVPPTPSTGADTSTQHLQHGICAFPSPTASGLDMGEPHSTREMGAWAMSAEWPEYPQHLDDAELGLGPGDGAQHHPATSIALEIVHLIDHDGRIMVPYGSHERIPTEAELLSTPLSARLPLVAMGAPPNVRDPNPVALPFGLHGRGPEGRRFERYLTAASHVRLRRWTEHVRAGHPGRWQAVDGLRGQGGEAPCGLQGCWLDLP
ncbi:hypothetical protein BDY21DRAFT_335209 [Lineolata rhizophorae]|uniref:Uncharacterized protein n=1 Tax=Lineolata rhizophorae TaxID=578093 RepID=A0A6A6P918_9PEZI|nr:hypothetical protein BDY21DRAFT_335209 [Lineolata rhizophorae]